VTTEKYDKPTEYIQIQIKKYPDLWNNVRDGNHFYSMRYKGKLTWYILLGLLWPNTRIKVWITFWSVRFTFVRFNLSVLK